MNLLESFLGNAAGVGANVIGDRMKAEEDARKDQRQNDLLMKRQLAIEALREEGDIRQEERKRENNLKAGKEISAESEKIGQERISKDMDKSNPIADASTWTPEMEAARNQGKQGLMATMTNTEKLGDSANAALKLGYKDEAKEIRGHQQIEMQSERDGRREEHDIKRENLADMRYQSDVEWRKERAAVEDRLATVRERLAGAAEARAGRAEKNQATAMDKAELNSSRQSLQAILKDVALQEEKINSQMASIQSKMADPNLVTPEQRKPFEDQLKSLEKRSNGLDAQRVSVRNDLRTLNGMEPYKAEKEAPEKKEYPTPNEAQIKFLMANPGNVKEFESKFGNGAIPMEFYQQNKEAGKQTVKAEALTKDNAKVLSSAGKTMMGESKYNVELPGGTTKVMSKSELERLGYKFYK